MLKEIDDIKFEIIFVTAHNAYAIQAFRYSAVEYLMKPVDEDLLIEAAKKAVKRIQSMIDIKVATISRSISQFNRSKSKGVETDFRI